MFNSLADNYGAIEACISRQHEHKIEDNYGTSYNNTDLYSVNP